jgi:hypothetical protein
MGLGSRFRFDQPEAQVFQDGLDDLPVFNETDAERGVGSEAA